MNISKKLRRDKLVSVRVNPELLTACVEYFKGSAYRRMSGYGTSFGDFVELLLIDYGKKHFIIEEDEKHGKKTHP